MPVLEVDSLRKQYDDVVAVDGISFDLEDGEFLVIVGPSGCGKSTTLNMIAGIEKPTSGTVTLNREDITDYKPQERDIAMVFQNYALYPHMDVKENIGFGLKMRTDLSESAIDERVQEVAELLDIQELLDSVPGDLSGGQQQRVALGRAIARDPDLFLMDEPLSNLDAKLRTTMRTEIQDLQQMTNVPTIYVTHNQVEAMTMGDRIAILNEGNLQQIATPLECYHQPANRFVGSFIGSPSMNFFDVSRDGETFAHDQFTYEIPEDLARKLPESSKDLTIGIRPEDLQIATSEVSNGIPATVRVVEPMGDVTSVEVEIADETYTAVVTGHFSGTYGDDVFLTFGGDDVYVFDQESGDSLIERALPDESEAASPELS